MNKDLISIFALSLLINTQAYSQNYSIGKITAKRIEITSVFDTCQSVKNAQIFLAPYKASVDSVISPAIGHSSMYMTGNRPESLLSNWAADALLNAANNRKDKKENVDFAVINIGGLRSALPKGKITTGDVLEMAPFQNMLTILSLKGSDVIELFNQFAIFGGEGISHGLELKYYDDRTLISAKLKGKNIKPNKIYRIATIDYLAEGNDNMKAFKKAIKVYNTGITLREVYMDNIKNCESKGQTISSKIEGRTIIIKK